MLGSIIKQFLLFFDLSHQLFCTQQLFIYNLMIKQPVNPQQLLKILLVSEYKGSRCVEDFASDGSEVAKIKQTLKNQITVMNLLQLKQNVTSQIKQLLNYRQSIDYDHKYKQIKFDHYQYPYRSSYKIKEELNNLRMDNLDRRRKIKELEEELKRKQRAIDVKRTQKENMNIFMLTNRRETKRENDCQQDFWLNRIDMMKSRFLNHEQNYRRAKVRHDYNLLIEKNGCSCKKGKVCPLCSDLNIDVTRTSFRSQALLSPRYSSIYPKRRF